MTTAESQALSNIQMSINQMVFEAKEEIEREKKAAMDEILSQRAAFRNEREAFEQTAKNTIVALSNSKSIDMGYKKELEEAITKVDRYFELMRRMLGEEQPETTEDHEHSESSEETSQPSQYSKFNGLKFRTMGAANEFLDDIGYKSKSTSLDIRVYTNDKTGKIATVRDTYDGSFKHYMLEID